MKDFYLDNYAIWTESELIDAKTREELESIADNDDELRDRFTHPMTFGTSGMRALMRAGYNGMNVYTVRCASQGLAETILKSGKEADGIVIAHDSRHNSSDFARDAAVVFAANGIKVYYFEDLRPTPQLSFAVRELGCIAGVNITASHNPKEYNGYKVYWSDGAQVGVAKADEISDEIIAADIFDSPKLCDFDEAVSDGRIVMLDNELDEKYIDCVLAESVAGDYVEKVADDFKVVYAAFHGAGAKFVPEVLKRLGIKKVFPVAEQMIPDGDFPTVISPNPENPQSYDIAIRYAESTKSDMIIGTDPDSDRCGVAVRTSDGFRLLSGNQAGLLLLDYVLQRLSEEGKLPSNGVAIRSLVST
ncbi:MAG: phospho-sugar mutase, partial [Mogibacterium sp.]|nr:phospho-sugar mutase [Mogibacterium sp.]